MTVSAGYRGWLGGTYGSVDAAWWWCAGVDVVVVVVDSISFDTGSINTLSDVRLVW